MPKIHRKPLPPGTRLEPLGRIATLGKSPLLDSLSGIELVVYLRLVALAHEQGGRLVQPQNADLYREPRTAGRALEELDALKLIRIERPAGASRKIWVL